MRICLDAGHCGLKQKPAGTFRVKVICSALSVRAGAGLTYPVQMLVRGGEVFTITEVQGSWGRLSSGAGWINITAPYCRRL